MQRRVIAAVVLGMLLSGCGAEAPVAEQLEPVEREATKVALSERPTLAPVAPAADRPTATPAPTLNDLYVLLNVRDDDPRALGQVDAPVVIIEFTDYE